MEPFHDINDIIKEIDRYNNHVPEREKILIQRNEKGKWIPIPYKVDDLWDGQCPYCNEKVIDGQLYNFCPHCGHPMEVDEKCK
jgi:rubrerythrin